MNRLLPAATLIALAGCASPPPPNPAVAFCRTQADSTPAVKALTLKSVSNPYFMSQQADLIAATKSQAVAECLKRQGIMPPGGGVEHETKPDSLF